MKTYKIAAFDMDGTLLDSNKQIRPDSLEAMTRAKALGKVMCLSTGRNLAELDVYRRQLPMVQYLMCVSGAIIVDNNTEEIVFSKSIDKQTALELFKVSNESDVVIHIHSDKSRFQKQDLDRLKDYGMGQYRDLFATVSTFHTNLYEDYLKNEYPIYKFNFYCKDVAERSRVEEKIKNLPITMCYAEGKSLECSPLGISKASGLEFLCKHLGFKLDEAIAVGDAENDIEILRAAGLGVAMGNAKEPVLKLADTVVADCDNGGIKEVIDRFLIGGGEINA